jgi:hypothetical protein
LTKRRDGVELSDADDDETRTTPDTRRREMKSLSEMSNAALATMKDEIAGMIREQMRAGRPFAELVRFEARIDDEMAVRGL